MILLKTLWAFARIKPVRLSAICWLVSALGTPVYSGPNDLLYPLRQDWSQSDSGINISSYVFNDQNENGTYDLGDRAFADIVVSLGQGGLPLAAVRTNINGFANFTASTTKEDAPLSAPGTFEFTVVPPPGWRVTTDNLTQLRELISIQGSIAGVGLHEMMIPVGLSRKKFIRGTYRGDGAGQLELRQGDKVVARASLAPGEQFFWPVKRGEYMLVTNGHSRRVTVGNNPVDIGLAGVGKTADGQGRTIDFEGGAPSGLNKTPNGYGGLNWFNLNIMRSDFTPDSVGYINGATSGNHIVYTSSGHPSRIYADAPFDFHSINISAAWPKSEGEEVVFAYFNDDGLIFRDSIGLSAYGPINYQPLIKGVTLIEISTVHYWQMVIDDVVVTTER